jgi:hypothetical protein
VLLLISLLSFAERHLHMHALVMLVCMHLLYTHVITLQITKAAVDGACVIFRGGLTPALEPCYGRALISGAVAGFASMIIADGRKLHPSFYPPKDYMVSSYIDICNRR